MSIHQMGTGVQPDDVSGLLQDGSERLGAGSLAVGPRDQNGPESRMGVPGLLQEEEGLVEAQLDAEIAQILEKSPVRDPFHVVRLGSLRILPVPRLRTRRRPRVSSGALP